MLSRISRQTGLLQRCAYLYRGRTIVNCFSQAKPNIEHVPRLDQFVKDQRGTNSSIHKITHQDAEPAADSASYEPGVIPYLMQGQTTEIDKKF